MVPGGQVHVYDPAWEVQIAPFEHGSRKKVEKKAKQVSNFSKQKNAAQEHSLINVTTKLEKANNK